MRKSNAAKRIAPNKSALIETPNLPVVACTPADSESSSMDVYYDLGDYIVSVYDAEDRKSRSCVLAMVNGGKKPSSTCDHCGQKAVGDVNWFGFLSDPTCSMTMPDDQPYVLVTSSDSVRGNREGIILILKKLARKLGYKFCELRDYPLDGYDYKPIFSGRLSALSSGT